MPDKKTVDEIDDSANDLAAMLPGYLSRREEDLEQIELFFIESNYKEIARIAHKMKGTGTGFGL
ncbi:MAG: Hpt domain-containing protein, partial [Bdellovibrionaceae bacterium]|nr:Hpt domain-containing protein [Pseudobdellovibrionaceae bacterium]